VVLTDKPILLAFEGPGGCGKGTQARLIASRRQHVRIIGVSGAIRGLAEADPTYRFALDIMKAGGLVPNDVVVRAVNCELTDRRTERAEVTILDGIPRSIGQARYLVADVSRFYDTHIVLMQLDDEVCLGRARMRYERAALEWEQSGMDPQKKPRDDDEDLVVRERLRLYRELEREIKSYILLNKGNVGVHLLPADSDPELIFQEINGRVFAA
jgi:adenylate kinase